MHMQCIWNILTLYSPLNSSRGSLFLRCGLIRAEFCAKFQCLDSAAEVAGCILKSFPFMAVNEYSLDSFP